MLLSRTLLHNARAVTCRRMMSTSASKDVGYIGLGAMGTPMVRNMMDAGFNVSVYDGETTRHP